MDQLKDRQSDLQEGRRLVDTKGGLVNLPGMKSPDGLNPNACLNTPAYKFVQSMDILYVEHIWLLSSRETRMNKTVLQGRV